MTFCHRSSPGSVRSAPARFTTEYTSSSIQRHSDGNSFHVVSRVTTAVGSSVVSIKPRWSQPRRLLRLASEHCTGATGYARGVDARPEPRRRAAPACLASSRGILGELRSVVADLVPAGLVRDLEVEA